MSIESTLAEIMGRQAEIIHRLDQVIATQNGDSDMLKKLRRRQEAIEALRPGTKLYGYCGGLWDWGPFEFGDKVIQSIEPDGEGIRIVVRMASDDDGDEGVAGESFASYEDAACLVEYTNPPREDD